MLRERAISAVVIAAVLLVVFVLGEPWIAAAVLVITFLAALEVFALLRQAGHPVLPILGMALALVVVVDAAAPAELRGSSVLLAAVGLCIVAVGAFALPDPKVGLVAWMATTFGGLYVAQLGFIIRLGSAVPPLPTNAPFHALGADRAWILLLVFGVWAYDTGAYFIGKQFGRQKFLTHLSASKTYAGLIGGLVATTIVTAIMLWGIGQNVLQAIVLGPLLGLAAQAGDLAESMLKRAAGAKDSSHLIPGHGGVLDRVDSFLFAAPVVTLYVVALVH
jgi:phosphatidate cytidylyltransferase